MGHPGIGADSMRHLRPGTDEATEQIDQIRGGASQHIAQNRLSQPILAWKAADSGKLPLIVGDDGITKGHGLSGNQQVIGANWPASLLQLRTRPFRKPHRLVSRTARLQAR